MNFFGHVVVARWHSDAARVHFGAMLPDFAGMIGAAAPTVHDADIAAGVAHHHATDDVFHRTDAFRSLSGGAARQLQEFGLSRGSALAVGHVGVELLIDCSLASEPAACSDYLAALRSNPPEELSRAVVWASQGHRRRFEQLLDVLADRGLAVVDPTPGRLAQRLQRILTKRPRLALKDADCGVVEAWAGRALPVVSTATPLLLQELRAGLERLGSGGLGEQAAQ